MTREIDGGTDFSFPVYGYQDQTTFKGGLGYSPLIESPGVAFIVGKDSYNFKEQMFQGVLGCWPVLAIPMVMTCIAGFMVWLLVRGIVMFTVPCSILKGSRTLAVENRLHLSLQRHYNLKFQDGAGNCIITCAAINESNRHCLTHANGSKTSFVTID